MSPMNRLMDEIESGKINAKRLRRFMCRCCNDKMPVISVENKVYPNGAKLKTMTYGKRKKLLRRANATPFQVEQAVEFLIRYLKRDKPEILEACSWKITKEGVAEILDVPEHQVAQAFQQLKQRGLMGTKENTPPHDSTRDPWGGHDSSWMGSTYSINEG